MYLNWIKVKNSIVVLLIFTLDNIIKLFNLIKFDLVIFVFLNIDKFGFNSLLAIILLLLILIIIRIYILNNLIIFNIKVNSMTIL